ncbi:MAG: hypothetical protein ACLQDY_06605 [Streptosporangiaceae bacterium]
MDEEPNVFVYPTTFVGGSQVPVFFRTFQAQSTDTTYDQSTTYW